MTSFPLPVFMATSVPYVVYSRVHISICRRGPWAVWRIIPSQLNLPLLGVRPHSAEALFCCSFPVTTLSGSSWGTTQTPPCGRSSNRQTWGVSCVLSCREQRTQSSGGHCPWLAAVLYGRGSPSGRSGPGALDSGGTPGFPGTSGCGWCAGCYEFVCQWRERHQKRRYLDAFGACGERFVGLKSRAHLFRLLNRSLQLHALLTSPVFSSLNSIP